MTDEELADLRKKRDAAIDNRLAAKRKMADVRTEIRRLAAEVQKLDVMCNEMAQPYKVLTEQVADWTAQIESEERRRAEEADAVRKAAKAEAEANAASEPVVIGEQDVGTITP